MKRLKELIATIFILLIIAQIASISYKAFKRSDFYKGTDFYKKELKLREEGKKELFKRFKKMKKNIK